MTARSRNWLEYSAEAGRATPDDTRQRRFGNQAMTIYNRDSRPQPTDRQPMTSRFHLQPLLDLAATRTDEAARKLGELVAAERDQAQKLEMLEAYRAEYNERFMQAARDGMSPDAWRNFSAFMGKLDEAITAQRKLVEQSQVRTAQGQQSWIAQHSRLKAFDTLSQRHQSALNRAEARREQKQADEHAARRYHSDGNDDDELA